MAPADLKKFIAASTAVIHRGRYAYLQTQWKQPGNHFLVSQDADEVTMVTEEKNLASLRYDKAEKWFTLIEFKTAVPFQGVGFIATIASALAGKGLNILVASTFSKDYFLVHREDANTAADALRQLGFPVQIES